MFALNKTVRGECATYSFRLSAWTHIYTCKLHMYTSQTSRRLVGLHLRSDHIVLGMIAMNYLYQCTHGM